MRPEFYDFDLANRPAVTDALRERRLRELSFVVFDVETTGLELSKGDEVVSIGAVRVVNGRVLPMETFERLVNPGRPIPPASVRFHGVTDADVRDKPPLAIVLPQFHRFADDAVLVAHNAAFDMTAIDRGAAACGLAFDHPVLDTLLISAWLDPEEADHSLDGIAARLGIEITARHNALGDALTEAAILVRQFDRLEARGIDRFGQLAVAIDLSARLRQNRMAFCYAGDEPRPPDPRRGWPGCSCSGLVLFLPPLVGLAGPRHGVRRPGPVLRRLCRLGAGDRAACPGPAAGAPWRAGPAVTSPLFCCRRGAYCALLFAVAALADRTRPPAPPAGCMCCRSASIARPGPITARSAAPRRSGIDFLPIYLGPTLVFVLGWPLLAKILRISNAHRITSHRRLHRHPLRQVRPARRAGDADRGDRLGALYRAAAPGGVVRACWSCCRRRRTAAADTLVALGAALLLAAFGVLFGAARIDPDEHHRGMVAAIALESVVKLACFAAVGLFAGLVLFDGFADLFARAARLPQAARSGAAARRAPNGPACCWCRWPRPSACRGSSRCWWWRTATSATCGPALWGFPLYLFAINLFVLPIAFAGLLLLPAGSDPRHGGADPAAGRRRRWLSLLAFIGGLSAATAMVVVESVALSTMVCNDLVDAGAAAPARPPPAPT